MALQRDNKRVDWNLEFLLARAYFESNQTGVARQKLWDIAEHVPQSVPPRVLLARLLINDHEMDQAREIVAELRRLAPGDPQVERLERQIMITEPTKLTPEAIDKTFAQMPETNLLEIRTKVSVAVATGKLDDAVRLLEVLRAQDAADVDAVRTLVQIYMSQEKKDHAKKVADDAIAKDPSNIALQILCAAVKNDQAEVKRLTLKGIESDKNPFEREMNFYEYYNSHGDPTEALKHLDAAELAGPEETRIMDLRFTTALLNAKWDVAQKYAIRLGVKNADEAHGLIYLYRLALARGDYKGAEEQAREMVKTLPQFAQSWLCFGEVLKEQRKFEEAANKFQNALQKQSENFEAYRGLIECYYELRKPDEAKRYIESGLKVLPGNPWLTEQHIAYDLNYGDPTKALAARQAAADLNPDSLGAQLANGAALWQVAQYEASKNRPEDSKKHLQAALDKMTAINTRWPDERIPYAYLADIYIFKGDFATGEKTLKDYAAREVAKDSPDSSMMLADLYARFGKMDLAEAAYDSALGKVKNPTAPPSIELVRKVAGFLTAQHKYDKAIQVLQPAASNRSVQQQMVEAMMSNDRLTDAAQFLDTNLKLNPNDSQFLATRGFLLLLEKKTSESLVALNRAIELDPRNQVALYYRGMIKFEQGPASLDDSIKDLTAARDIADDPRTQASVNTQVQTRVALAEAYRAHGQIEDAVQEMTTCLQQQPMNKEIRVRLIELLGALAPPRWNEVERLINEARKIKGYEKDSDWPRLLASMWTSRDKPENALDAIRDALKLAQGDVPKTMRLVQDYLNILDKAKKYRDLLAQCDELLNTPGLADSSWWIYQMRAVAYAHTDGKRAEALTDFDKALEIAGKIRSDDATAVIIQGIADTIGVDEAIIRCEREANKGDKPVESDPHLSVLLQEGLRPRSFHDRGSVGGHGEVDP